MEPETCFKDLSAAESNEYSSIELSRANHLYHEEQFEQALKILLTYEQQLLHEHKSQQILIRTQHLISLIQFKLEQYSTSIEKALRCVELINKVRSRLTDSQIEDFTKKSYTVLASSYFSIGDLEHALHYFIPILHDDQVLLYILENISIQQIRDIPVFLDALDRIKSKNIEVQGHVKKLKGLLYEDKRLALKELFEAIQCNQSKKFLSSCFQAIALAYSDLGSHSDAIYYFKKLLEHTKFPQLKLYAHKMIGNEFKILGNYQKASNHMKKAMNFIMNEKEKFEVNYTLGKYFYHLSNMDEALLYFQVSLNALPKTDISANRNVVLNSIGKAYMKKTDYENALKYFFKSLKWCEQKLGETEMETALVYFYIGQTNLRSGYLNRTYNFLAKSYNISSKIKSDEAQLQNVNCLKCLGNYYEMIDDKRKAKNCYTFAFRVLNKLNRANQVESLKIMSKITKLSL